MEKTRKYVVKTFEEFSFKIDIKSNLKTMDFLGVTFNLANNIYRTYKKQNDNLIYLNTFSIFPTDIIKQLPRSIAKIVSNNSSTEHILNLANIFHMNY